MTSNNSWAISVLTSLCILCTYVVYMWLSRASLKMQSGRQIYMSWKETVFRQDTRAAASDGGHVGTCDIKDKKSRGKADGRWSHLHCVCVWACVATGWWLQYRACATWWARLPATQGQTEGRPICFQTHSCPLTPTYVLSYPSRMLALASHSTLHKIHAESPIPPTYSPVTPTSFATLRPTFKHCCFVDYDWPCFVFWGFLF